MSIESERLKHCWSGEEAWYHWGPYLSERQWGTVREDYSADGSAWEYFPHDAARSRAYRWGEDGIAGFADEKLRLCLSFAMWNKADPIIKERLFGLTNHEGNHAEDVKECYYYLDATPTHSYMKYLYKYPQRAFPYNELVAENRRRGRELPEFELMDTGVFAEDAYFDVFIEYAKAAPADLCMRITVRNRGDRPAPYYGLFQLAFRNTWMGREQSPRPVLFARSPMVIETVHDTLENYWFYGEEGGRLLFCDNETNSRRFGDGAAAGVFYKDGINDYLIRGDSSALKNNGEGTRAAAVYESVIPAHAERVWRARLSASPVSAPFSDHNELMQKRIAEADEFYAELQTAVPTADRRLVQRQALAGMLWNKQYYNYQIPEWLFHCPENREAAPQRRHARNAEWLHLNNFDIISMPDKWEYPWYATWDLAFHTIALAMIDREFAKQQLVLITLERYMHPNGEFPAYEWNFNDANPPVHAWAAWRVYQIDRNANHGKSDLFFLERVLHKLLLNFTWWVNRKDVHGLNIFQGGFLGLDNIGVFNRSAQLPAGGYLHQADGTSWMAMYCLNLLRIALELALHNRVYEDIAIKFFEHFLLIAAAMNNMAGRGIGLWDEDDQFYYDALNLADGQVVPLKVRSMVGLIPLFAVETIEPEMLEQLPTFRERLETVLRDRPDLAQLVSRWYEPGRGERRLLSLLRGHRMKALLRRALDEQEFLSPFGVRALSKYHEKHPYVFDCSGSRLEVRYEPGESASGTFGGNSNWRGPVWFPVNYLLIEALQKFHHYYGDDFKIECPTGSGRFVTINQVAEELTGRLCRLFLRDDHGLRPCFGACDTLQSNSGFRDCLLFNEYFHGETGAGLGAAHQTGWTGLVAKLLQPRRPARACSE